MPRWLVLLLTGIAIGAAGVIVVQERYLPPRLSATESTELHQSFEQADKDRTRLKADDEARANFVLAREQRFILREARTFLEPVEGTAPWLR